MLPYLEPTGMTPEEMESRIMAELDLPAFPVATQVYPRKQDWLVLNALAGPSRSLYKFAFDLRLLQAPSLGEWSEPLGRDRLGRRHAVQGIRFNQRTSIRWPGTSPHCLVLPGTMRRIPLLERTLDDSGNRREVLPSAFLAVDEILGAARRILGGLQIYEGAIARNLAMYGDFAATERLLMVLVSKGRTVRRCTK